MINQISSGESTYGMVKTPSGDYIDDNCSEAKTLKRTGAVECETCKNRKYVDDSNESDVSFQSPGHVSATASTSVVRAHEQQHVANAYQTESSGKGRVMSVNVSIKMGRCAECGRSYAKGGETKTTIKYNEDVFAQNIKSVDAANGAIGENFESYV